MSAEAAVTLEDVVAAARALAAQCVGETCAEAAAWVLRNRALAAFTHRRATGRVHPEFGDGSLSGAAWAPGLEPLADARAFWRAAAALCATLSGDSADPTGGATDWRRIVNCSSRS